jgi:hypothetical protein
VTITRIASTTIVSLLWSVTVLAAVPGPPAALTAGVSGNMVSLAWQAPSTGVVAGYVIEAALSPGGPAIATVPIGQTSLVVPGVPDGVYYVRVRAINAEGLGPASNEVVAAVPGTGGCAAPPGPPTSLSGSATGSAVSLQWVPPAAGCAASSYAVQAGSAPGLSNIAVVNVGPATSLSASAPNGTYYVRVVAVNAFGGSTPSSDVTVTVGVVTPGAPLLTFTVTPNPVPFTGIFAGCAGTPVPSKTWSYIFRITNQGTRPFTIALFSGRVTSPLLPLPIDTPYSAQVFALAFGGSTIPPQGSLVGGLCVFGERDDSTLTWTFVDVSGQSFTAPLIRFLRSPF